MSYSVITFPTESLLRLLSSLLAFVSAGTLHSACISAVLFLDGQVLLKEKTTPLGCGWASPQRMKSLHIVSAETVSQYSLDFKLQFGPTTADKKFVVPCYMCGSHGGQKQ